MWSPSRFVGGGAAMLNKLLLATYAVVARATCESWCNPYTCDSGASAQCDTCSVCSLVTGGTYCAAWCNA